MKRTVKITIEVDPTDYYEEDTALAALKLVLAMLEEEADYPNTGISVECEDINFLF